MSSSVTSVAKKGGKITTKFLYEELGRLRERVEDLEDLRTLNAAIAANNGKKLVSWATAKEELGLED